MHLRILKCSQLILFQRSAAIIAAAGNKEDFSLIFSRSDSGAMRHLNSPKVYFRRQYRCLLLLAAGRKRHRVQIYSAADERDKAVELIFRVSLLANKVGPSSLAQPRAAEPSRANRFIQSRGAGSPSPRTNLIKVSHLHALPVTVTTARAIQNVFKVLFTFSRKCLFNQFTNRWLP